jgi:hypothetical protein
LFNIGEENIFNQDVNEDFDEDEYRELEVPNQFLTVTDKRLANKAAAFAALANMLHNMPTNIMMGYVADIIPTIASSVAAPGSEGTYTFFHPSITLLKASSVFYHHIN